MIRVKPGLLVAFALKIDQQLPYLPQMEGGESKHIQTIETYRLCLYSRSLIRTLLGLLADERSLKSSRYLEIFRNGDWIVGLFGPVAPKCGLARTA